MVHCCPVGCAGAGSAGDAGESALMGATLAGAAARGRVPTASGAACRRRAVGWEDGHLEPEPRRRHPRSQRRRAHRPRARAPGSRAPRAGRPDEPRRPRRHPRQRATRRRGPRPRPPPGARGRRRRRRRRRPQRAAAPARHRRRHDRRRHRAGPLARRPCSGAAPTASTSCAPCPRCSARPSPGSARPMRELRPSAPPEQADPERIRATIAEAPDDSRAMLERMTWGPAFGVLPTAAPGRTTARWLLEHHLLVPVSTDRVALPREVGLVLRRGPPAPVGRADAARHRGPHRSRSSTPPPAARRASASPTSTSSPPTWGAEPPRVLRAGGLSVRDLRVTQLALDLDPEHTAFVVELAYAAGPRRRRRRGRAGVGSHVGDRRVELERGRAPVGDAGPGLARLDPGTTPRRASEHRHRTRQRARPRRAVAGDPRDPPRGAARARLARAGQRARPRLAARAPRVAPTQPVRRRARRGRRGGPARGRVARRDRPRRPVRGRPGACSPPPRRPSTTWRPAMARAPALARRPRPRPGRPHRRRPRAARRRPRLVHAPRRRRRVPRRRDRLPLHARVGAPRARRRVDRAQTSPRRCAGRAAPRCPSRSSTSCPTSPASTARPASAARRPTSAPTTRRCSTRCSLARPRSACGCGGSPRRCSCRPPTRGVLVDLLRDNGFAPVHEGQDGAVVHAETPRRRAGSRRRGPGPDGLPGRPARTPSRSSTGCARPRRRPTSAASRTRRAPGRASRRWTPS